MAKNFFNTTNVNIYNAQNLRMTYLKSFQKIYYFMQSFFRKRKSLSHKKKQWAPHPRLFIKSKKDPLFVN